MTTSNSCKIIKITETQETKKFLEENSNLWVDFFGEKGWETVVIKQITQRKTGNLELPQLDFRTGKNITLRNLLSDKLYEQTHVYSLTPHTETERIILYLHGGAYIFGIEPSQIMFCDRLSSKLNATVIMPLYNLAPQGNYRDAYKLLHEVYGELQKKNIKNKPVCIVGDSSGGGLALGFVMDLKAKSKKLPDKMVLLSPWLDVTMSNPENARYEAKDLMLSRYGLIECGKMWAAGDDRTDYRISPINGSVSGLPSTLITVATAEIFYPDIQKLFQIYKENKQSCTLIEGQGLFHVFPIMSPIPEAIEVQKLIFDFIKE
ncbi:MAG: alpha/beta hydrolase [Synergistaceae bacterium]|nr:alpha/beta hydrolase [Synergistaceae bacterium]